MHNIKFSNLNYEVTKPVVTNGINHDLLRVGSMEDMLLEKLIAVDRKYIKLLNDPTQVMYYNYNLKKWDIERNYILDKINPPLVKEEGCELTLDDVMYFE